MTAILLDTDSSLGLDLGLQPMTAAGESQPFAWTAVIKARDGRSFAQVSAALKPSARQALEAQRISMAIRGAVAAGLLQTEAMLAIPMDAAADEAEALLTHLFRTALAHGFPVARLVVEVNADDGGDLERVAGLARACVSRSVGIALDGFAAGPVSLGLLARFTPRFVKLAAALTVQIDASPSRRRILEGVVRLAAGMRVRLVAGASGSRATHKTLEALGLEHFQIDWIMPVPHGRCTAAAPLPARRPAPAARAPRLSGATLAQRALSA